MRPFQRANPPDFLHQNGSKWGKEYARQKLANPKYNFKWKTLKGKPLNHHIEPLLAAQTDDHCSYCDAYPPLKPDNSIDHFLPKGDRRFYHLAYEWTNLYKACAHCQSCKLDKYDEALLRPDEIGYSFLKYFKYNWIEHTIEPSPDATEEDQQRAFITAEIFGFNHLGQVKSRKLFWRIYARTEKEQFEEKDLPFRFMLAAI
ncbi:MAG: hypothetical protein H6577_11335 [Lewinellaceae bacterium]|nr:hypothetical protein [Saprospiraceae bacterium]MCB9338708.1 hypothetical protein [Lewinellaceae bacterium]